MSLHPQLELVKGTGPAGTHEMMRNGRTRHEVWLTVDPALVEKRGGRQTVCLDYATVGEAVQALAVLEPALKGQAVTPEQPIVLPEDI